MNVFFIIVALLIAGWFFLYKKNAGSQMDKHRVSKRGIIRHGKYHCVTIHSGKHACEAVKKLQDKRILSSEAPSLPLSACDTEQCQCKYLHHEERRAGERRGIFNKAFEEINGATIKMYPRQNKDRRKSP